jgi:hypothetical protein
VIIEGLLVAFVVGIGLAFVAGGVFLVKGVGGHLWERWAAFFAALESRRWVVTTGRVTRSVVTYTTSRRGRSYTPAVRYTYSVGGERLVADRFAFSVAESAGDEGAAAARAVVERFWPGNEVHVFYDPENPSRATLDRSVPPVLGPTLGWLLVLLVGAGVLLSLGVIIVQGPFEDPPNLGDVPLREQLGSLAVVVGALFVLAGGVRAVSADERRERRLLQRLESAKLVLAREVRAGEPVVVAGRAELEDPGDLDLPFEDAPLVYYDVDADVYRRTCSTAFDVRDASGVVSVDLGDRATTVLPSRRVRVEGAVERWLDEQRDEGDEPIPAAPAELRLECIRIGDPVLVFGRAEREEGTLVFRVGAADPASLLVTAGTREDVAARLRLRLGRTRAFLLSGAGLLAAGLAALASG